MVQVFWHADILAAYTADVPAAPGLMAHLQQLRYQTVYYMYYITIYFKRPYAFTTTFLAYKLWHFIQAKFPSHYDPHYTAPG